LNDLPSDSLSAVQAALDKFVMPEEDAEAVIAVVEESPVAVLPSVEVAPADEEEETIPAAFGDEPEPVVAIPPIDRGQPARKPLPVRKEAEPVVDEEVEDEDEDVDVLLAGGKPGKKEKKKKKKERQQRRQLIFDEEIGQVIAKRRRKGGREQGWEDEE
jgi:hypothetical protein